MIDHRRPEPPAGHAWLHHRPAVLQAVTPLLGGWPVLAGLGTLLIVWLDRHGIPADTELFIEAGRRLFSADGINVYADPIIQAGASELGFYALMDWVERLLGVPRFQLISIVLQLAVTFGVIGLVTLPFERCTRSAPRALLLLAGVVAVAQGFGSQLYLAGHPAQFAIVVLWTLAARASLRGATTQAALLLALSAAWETWGVLGVPVLLLAPSLQAAAKGAVVAGAASVAAYAPFAIFGDFAMHRFAWTVRPQSALVPLLGVDAPFGWRLRLAQGAATLVVAGLVAWRLRGHAHGLWAVPVTIEAVRLLFDPVGADYHWIPVRVLALVAIAAFVAARDGSGLYIWPLLYPAFLPGAPQWLMAAAVLVGVAMVVVDSARAVEPRPPQPTEGDDRVLTAVG